MSETGRQPPFSEEAERAVLGSALIDSEKVIPLLREQYGTSKQHFYVPAHNYLWEVLDGMFCDGNKVDLLTVGERLKNAGLLEKVGGYVRLEQLIDGTPTSAHVEYYADIVRKNFLLRSVSMIACELIDEVYQPEVVKDPETFLGSIPDRFFDLAEVTGHQERSRAEVFQTVIDEVREAKERQDAIRRGEPVGPPPYVSTGFDEVDMALGGGMRNFLYILGAEQSAGKTTLAAQIARNVARNCRGREQVLILSLDADQEEHAARDMTYASGVSLPRLMAGFARHDQVERYAESSGRLTPLPIVIDEHSCTLPQQLSKIRMLNMKGPLKLIVMDYIQLSRIGDHRIDMDRNYAVSALAKAYKAIAREIGCPFLALSQFNNQGKRDMSRFAMMGDLRDSGELAEVPHGIWLLSKDRDLKENGKVIHHGAPEENHIRPVWWDLAKNKNGPVGKVEMWLYAHYFRFEAAGEGAFEEAREKAERGEPVHPAESHRQYEERQMDDEQQELEVIT
jgi:replicative DNA helicase